MTTPELTAAYKTVLTAMGWERHGAMWSYRDPSAPTDKRLQRRKKPANIDANFVFGTVVPWMTDRGFSLALYGPGDAHLVAHGDGFWAHWLMGNVYWEGRASAAHDAIMLAAAAALEAQG